MKQALSEILRDVAQVFFASMVVGNFFVERRLWVIAWGLAFSLFFWVLSLFVISVMKE